MAQEKQQEGISPNVPGGLNTDSALVTQPEGTTRFVFTGVNETKEGDYGFIANEESNQECYPIPLFAPITIPPTPPTPYIPMGKVYIGDENNLLFLAHPSGNSIIAILDKECALTIAVDDRNQVEKLGFDVTQQIDATFRLRRGCERVVYWVDPKPRIFIIDKPEEFKVSNVNSDWDISKFNLFKTYKKIPEVEQIKVLDGGGRLAPGSYNFSIQYLDEDFNPTEFVTSTETIMIYNSPSTTDYRDIRGATKEKNDTYLQFEDSTKAIKIVFKDDTLDTTYPFYRIAITEANAGGGLISDTKFTSEISTKQLTFIYTGINYESSGTQAEVTMFNNIIEKAQSIEQIENRLILGNTKGKPINFCKLQKYASKINADLVTRTVVLSELDSSNAKDPAAHFNGLGYMPGEIYSFGIVYIFKDNTTSPVFHIPGKSPDVPLNQMYSIGAKVYPMSNVDNSCAVAEYLDNNTCGEDLFWGRDFLGTSLTGEKVRHHRFPLRTDYGIPFVEVQRTDDPNNDLDFVRTLIVSVTKAGAICPVECPVGVDDCVIPPHNFGAPVVAPSTYRQAYNYKINYTEDSVAGELSDILDPYDNVVVLGENTTQDVKYFNTNPITVYGMAVEVVDIVETFEYNPDPLVITTNTVDMGSAILDPVKGYYYYQGVSDETGMTYRVDLVPGAVNKESNIYTSEIFGIKFSNIDVPSLEDTNGQEITGYYIVRNERKEEDRTIVDSAVFTSTIKEKNFLSQGLLFPEFNPGEQATRVQRNVVGVISPEYKFNDVKYSTYSKIIQQGEFKKVESIKSRTKINDVAPGSGYVDGKHKDSQKDEDGFTLQIKTRDTTTKFVPSSTTPYKLLSSDIKEVYYLAALENKLTKVKDNTDPNKEIELDVFNLAGDNRTGIMTFNNIPNFNTVLRLPYVYLYRDNLEPYSNFRLDPYYKDSQNPHTFTGTGPNTCEIFNGDSYISPIRYVNSIYYDIRMRKRVGKKSILKIVFGGLLVLAAIAVTIFTLGAGAPLIAVAATVAVAGAVVGIGTTLAISGIKQEAWNNAYNNLYAKGLRQTITDNYLKYDLDPYSLKSRGFEQNPEDDEIQWLGDCANLWFESAVNMGLRHGATDNTPDFVNAPGRGEAGTTYPEWDWPFFGLVSVGSSQVPATTTLDFHMVKKLTYLDSEKKEGRGYLGLPAAEIYALNPDYKRRNKQKAYNALGLEYDCCSDCIETFPNRWYWSEQAFQEELTDNFRMFLPNNYKDLEAETGEITDIYRIQNSLYVHSAEGLWHCPQTFQERVTSDIISFIGTGEYFSIPPRKIVDDANSSAGNVHKWARTKTKFGVLFPSFKEKKWYLFDGQQLKPISDTGNGNYFKTHMDFLIEQQYYKTNLQQYPYRNNPSNSLGVGFLSTYDTNKERLIVTKKDMKITNLPLSDYEICTDGGTPVVFNNISQTIAARLANGWNYIGIENCLLKFEKITFQERTTIVNQYISVPNDIDIWVFFDTSGSFLAGDLAQIEASLDNWVTNDLVPTGWAGNVYKVNTASEKWLEFPNQIPLVDRNKVLLISFVNEAEGDQGGAPYHGGALDFAGQPSARYTTNYDDFTEATGIYSTFDRFIGINYPIATVGTSKSFILHSLAAVRGRDWTLEEVNAIPRNRFFNDAEWESLKAQLLNNPYSNLLGPDDEPGLEQYNWVVKPDRSNQGSLATTVCPASTLIISPCQFAEDMNTILAALTEITEAPVTTASYITEIEYEQGTPFVPQILNNGYTMSYSLKKQEWTGWHPYIPSFYMHVQEKFYSWPQGSTSLYKHNRPNHYQTFYGVRYPFIVEYVDNPSAMTTKIWSNLLFQTEAKKFDPISEEYIDQRYVTFNKALFYNTQQISGLLTLAPKQDDNVNYLLQQTNNTQGVAIIDRNERDWTMNSMRDIRDNYTVPMFLKDLPSLQTNYYIDKVVNPAAINFNKDWTQLESFRDKYLVVRLIFDNFADTRLIFNFSALQRSESER